MNKKRLYLLPALAVAALVATPAHAEPCDDELDGPVRAVDAATRTIQVAGLAITVTDATRIEFDNGGRATFDDIKEGRVIEIDGTRTEDGWVACEIDIRPKRLLGKDTRHQVESRIESIDLAARVLVVGGVRVQVTNSTRIEGDDDRKLLLEDLKVGEEVEVEGAVKSGDVLEARSIER